MKAFLITDKGKQIATIMLHLANETPRSIVYKDCMYMLKGDGNDCYIYQAESFMVVFDDGSEVVYAPNGEKVSTKDKYGLRKIMEYEVKQGVSKHPAPTQLL